MPLPAECRSLCPHRRLPCESSRQICTRTVTIALDVRSQTAPCIHVCTMHVCTVFDLDRAALRLESRCTIFSISPVGRLTHSQVCCDRPG